MDSFIQSLQTNVTNDLTAKVIAFCQILGEQSGGKCSAEDLIKLWNETTQLFIDPALLKTKVVVAPPSSAPGAVGASVVGVPPPPAPGGCTYIFQRGQNKGCACGKKTYAGTECKTHYKGIVSGGSTVSAVSQASAAVSAAAPSAGVGAPGAVGAGGVTADVIRSAPNITALKKIAQTMSFKGYSRFTKDTAESLREQLLATLPK